jgi:hypothetical protein
VGAGGESLLEHGALEEFLGVGGELAVGANLTSSHLRIGEDFFPDTVEGCGDEALALAVAGGEYAGADRGGVFDGGSATEFFVLDGGDFDVNIDAVEERAADFGNVALDDGRSAVTLAGLVVEIAARAGVHRGGQHEGGGEGEGHGGAGDGDVAVFEGLAHDFENVARELGQLVEEEDAIVGEGYFAGAGDDAAADEAGVGDGVVRGRGRGAGWRVRFRRRGRRRRSGFWWSRGLLRK